MTPRRTFLARLGLSPSAYVGLFLLSLFVLAGLFGPGERFETDNYP